MPKASSPPNPDGPAGQQWTNDSTAGERLIALETLAAFIGAVLGAAGALAGTLTGDAFLSVVAITGAALCATVWVRGLDVAPLDP